MSFLGKNINLALTVLILIIILAATGVTILYQRGLRVRTTQYENVSSNLSQCLKAVANYQDVLSQKEVQLNATSQDIRKYDVLYTQKVSELDQKQQELTTTQTNLNAMTLQKEQFKELYGGALLNISNLQTSIGNLQNQLATTQDLLYTCQGNLNACQKPK
jgi:chromosome segregation ATPase